MCSRWWIIVIFLSIFLTIEWQTYDRCTSSCVLVNADSLNNPARQQRIVHVLVNSNKERHELRNEARPFEYICMPSTATIISSRSTIIITLLISMWTVMHAVWNFH
ncbi:unnamed protein product [Adineta ricciae]|uniref:Secreted protein n=1 Tax=Adineta ricciae TaxID=249248 RepID=A0A814PFM3_ADIRI|nr:unnamed protein product [Adineta ricciae]CAF1103129.1 unnamed protein product [Adineta ricciae]